jgi:hypothetical protein
MPGALFTYLLMGEVSPAVLGDRHAKLDGVEAWAAFLFASDLFGRLLPWPARALIWLVFKRERNLAVERASRIKRRARGPGNTHGRPSAFPSCWRRSSSRCEMATETHPTLTRAPSGQLSAIQNRSKRFYLFVGSHLCAPMPPSFAALRRSWLLSRSSPSRQALAGLPLSSASGYSRPQRGHYRYSPRGLSSHRFMPMPGVHKPSTRRARTHARDGRR